MTFSFDSNGLKDDEMSYDDSIVCPLNAMLARPVQLKLIWPNLIQIRTKLLLRPLPLSRS